MFYQQIFRLGSLHVIDSKLSTVEGRKIEWCVFLMYLRTITWHEGYGMHQYKLINESCRDILEAGEEIFFNTKQ